jgi:hypothetical protein
MTTLERPMHTDLRTRKLLAEISLLPQDWHGAGTMSNPVLDAIVKHSLDIKEVRYSAETGSGKTTLLFSHLSQSHTVFAVDDGNSISRVKNSDLFNRTSVTYVEGPSQITLPRYKFTDELQLVLIDGPHAYPFPDLEYYYFYPLIAEGGLLLIDDINIPSIRRMFEIVRLDDMFKLLEVVENTAFFRRTSAPVFDPLGDDWPLQGFNREFYEYALARGGASQNFPEIRRFIPQRLKQLIPLSWKTKILRKL